MDVCADKLSALSASVCSMEYVDRLWLDVQDQSGWLIEPVDVCADKPSVLSASVCSMDHVDGLCLDVQDQSGWSIEPVDVCADKLSALSASVCSMEYVDGLWLDVQDQSGCLIEPVDICADKLSPQTQTERRRRSGDTIIRYLLGLLAVFPGFNRLLVLRKIPKGCKSTDFVR